MKQPKCRYLGTPQEWLEHVASDLRVAWLGRGDPAVLPAHVCFHAQQAIEKGIKAVLLSRGVDFPPTHDIEELLHLAESNAVPVPAFLAEAGSLTPYAVETRYPFSEDEIAEQEVDTALRLAEQTQAWAESCIKSDSGGDGTSRGLLRQ